jgi:hypothetical protein
MRLRWVGERGPTGAQPRRVVGQQAHEASDRRPVGIRGEVEGQEHGVGLRVRLDAGLVLAVERFDRLAGRRGGRSATARDHAPDARAAEHRSAQRQRAAGKQPAAAQSRRVACQIRHGFHRG